MKTFVDTNLIMYAVGRPHPLRDDAREFFEESLTTNRALVTSAEVLQELLHVYLPVDRIETLRAALELATSTSRARRCRRLKSTIAVTTASLFVVAPVCRRASRSSFSGISIVVFTHPRSFILASQV